MFGWVSQWVPALFALKSPSDELPIGVIFACLMLCISTGANLFAAAQSHGTPVRTLMTLTLALSFCSMCLPFLVPYPPSFTLVLMAFCGFEAACGAFMPAMGVLRAELIPSSMQSTIMSAYRLPLNAVVVGVTHLGKTGVGSWKGWEAACLASAIFFAFALVFHGVGSSLPPPASSKSAGVYRATNAGDRTKRAGRSSSKSPAPKRGKLLNPKDSVAAKTTPPHSRSRKASSRSPARNQHAKAQ